MTRKRAQVEIEREEEEVKLTRIENSGNDGNSDQNNNNIFCRLPPVCASKPESFATTAAFEDHYARHHTNVCSLCHAEFPSFHFLNLHLDEYHNPIFAAQIDRGEAVFACFVERCLVLFHSITARRKHSERVHGFPPEYRFNLTKVGLARHTTSLLYPANLIDKSEVKLEASKSETIGQEKQREMQTKTRQEDNKSRETKGIDELAMEELVYSVAAVKLVPSSIRFGKRGVRP